ncbi:possible phosphoheptose isomerase [hydrothermal vent metagenome]|uniref:Possible phosphoheptose isomerase n=1 Tax=hydrothermal vent metagenome TaxID=652676 RepID=A0A3B1CQ86_9ZZZZ
MNWQSEIDKISKYLAGLSIRTGDGKDVDMDQGFEYWVDQARKLKAERKVCYLIGNGASASIASHMAADLAKNASIHTQVFSDLALITAMANDIGYEDVYSGPLQSRGNSGDMLVAISSSGESPNILNSVRTALALDMVVVTLSAMDEANPLRSSGSLNLYVPAKDYGHAETCHAAILHFWMDLVSRAGKGQGEPAGSRPARRIKRAGKPENA